jgi:chromosomal replication initiation ATPase DnaA
MKTIPQIINAAAGVIGVDPLVILKSHPTKMAGIVRHAAMFVARRDYGYGLAEIATGFELKSHGAVVYAVRRIDDTVDNDKNVKDVLGRIRRVLNGRKV